MTAGAHTTASARGAGRSERAEDDAFVADVVAQLRRAREETAASAAARSLPSREALAEVVGALRAALFPLHTGARDASPGGLDRFVAQQLGRALPLLERQVADAVHDGCAQAGPTCARCTRRARDVVRAFARELADIGALLATDVEAAVSGDPAARTVDEAIICYPGVTAILHHRLAHVLDRLGVPLIPRMIAALAHASTGIDVHPSAAIGPSFFIDHGTGVVIGETAQIGARVRMYQGVTLGARSFPTDASGRVRKGMLRHPIIEDDVVLYAGATILGRIRIGAGSVIGGNVWVTRSVPPRSTITQAQAQSEAFEGGGGI